MVLGAEHPLARAIDACESAVRQCRAVAAVLIGCAVPVAAGRAWAQDLGVSAAAVLVVLVLILASRLQARRDLALDLIVCGQEKIALDVVQRQRLRLIGQGTRDGLARSLDDLVDQACDPHRSRRLRPLAPLFDYQMIRSLTDELQEIAGLLRNGQVGASGVARVERLMTHGCSPLYGRDREQLRIELDHARRLLVSGRARVKAR
jgi:hypothetical protein